MSFKTIIAYISSPDIAVPVIQTAVKIAEPFDAHLIGLHVTPAVPVYITEDLPLPGMINKKDHEHHKEMSEKIESLFKIHTANSAIATEWRHVDADLPLPDFISQQAQTTDLLVIGNVRDETHMIQSICARLGA